MCSLEGRRIEVAHVASSPLVRLNPAIALLTWLVQIWHPCRRGVDFLALINERYAGELP
jgi:hypothetical protein